MARRKEELTPGETDVLNLIERGNAVDQIAETKGITKPAVYHYIRRLKNKGHLHREQRIPSHGVPSQATPATVVEQPTSVITGNGQTNGHYGYEVAFDTLVKSGTAEARECDALAMNIQETEEMLAEMKDRLTLLESRRDALQNAGKALDPKLVDTSQFAMAE